MEWVEELEEILASVTWIEFPRNPLFGGWFLFWRLSAGRVKAFLLVFWGIRESPFSGGKSVAVYFELL